MIFLVAAAGLALIAIGVTVWFFIKGEPGPEIQEPARPAGGGLSRHVEPCISDRATRMLDTSIIIDGMSDEGAK